MRWFVLSQRKTPPTPPPSTPPVVHTRYDSAAAVTVVTQLREQGGMYARALGNVAYIMVSPTTPAEVCRGLMASLEDVIIQRDGAVDDGEKIGAWAHEEVV